MRVAIRADVLYRALKTTAFAASRDFDPRRPAFSGVLLDVSPTAFRAVATDGYRLAYFESDGGYDCREPLTVLLHAGELVALKLPRRSDATIKIAVNDAEAVIQHEKAAFHVPIIQARFPKYLDLFPPAQKAISLYCEKAEFAKALLGVRQKTTRQNRNVIFWAHPSCIVMAAEAASIVPPVRITAQCEYSAFGVLNCDYLRDAIQTLPPGEMRIRFNPPNAERPILSALELSSANQSHGVIRHLVMPCRHPVVPVLPEIDS